MKSLNLGEIYRNCVRLLDTGCTAPEIERLSQFRHNFQQTSGDLSDLNLDIRQLEFIRWLVENGKLSDW
jgi:hypothetical protein